jgi:hypothetical protein
MLENFLLRSARAVRNGFTCLARDGYEIVLSPDLRIITGYATAHRERTWSQVQAGINSRFRGSSRRDPSGQRPEPGTALASPAVPTAVDPVGAHLTARVRTSFAKMFDLHTVDDLELDLRIRTTLYSISSGRVNLTRAGAGVEVIVGNLRWLISEDAQTIVGVGWASAQMETTDGKV